jgi:carbonic anhydrase/acetyltransferase-like protein (isoleucine patch superfamily)
MIEGYLEKRPRFGAGARAHATAVLIGDVELGAEASVWPCAVLRGDYNRIVVGRGSNVQDGAVLHNDHDKPCLVGEDVIIGHSAVVHGCTVGDRCLIGMNATILNGAVLGEGCIIGAGALVGEGKVVPPRSLVVGVPGRVLRPVSDEEYERIKTSAASYRGYASRQLPLAQGD